MLQFFRDHQADQIYAYEFMQKLGLGLIGIFIPIYILEQGWGLEWAFRFLLAQYGVMGLASIPSSYIIARIGFKHSMILSYVFYVPALLVLQVLGVSAVNIYLTAVLLALGGAFHWIALHGEFAVDTDKSERGEATGKMLGLPKVSGALAPMAGGALMVSLGFPVLVGVSVGILCLSAIPLLASGDHRDPERWRLASVYDRDHLKFASLFFLRGVSGAVGRFFFPLYVFLAVGGTFNAGAVSSMAGLGSTVFALFIGRATEKVDPSRLIWTGAFTSALFFFLMMYVTTPFQAFYISFGAGLLFMLYYIPIFSDLANIAEAEDVMEFFAFREVCLALGRIAILVTGIYLVSVYSLVEALKISFLIAAASTALVGFYASFLKEELQMVSD